ncbi:hypothetical protein [Bacillus bombysepticus]|uniref:hypothetical protein n=1 Tax=Bacillus bombysepticus TaxID=658666 RepID=UPI003017C7B2
MANIALQLNEMKNNLKKCVAECNPKYYKKIEGPTKKHCKDMLDFMKKNKYGETLRSLVKDADKTNNSELILYSASVFSCYIRYKSALEVVQTKTEVYDPNFHKHFNMV